MARVKTIQGLSQRNITPLAWREMKTTEDVHDLLSQVRRATNEATARFVSEELGFGSLLGPSIITTLQQLDEINRANLEKRPPRLTVSSRRQRVTGERARRAIHSIVGSRPSR